MLMTEWYLYPTSITCSKGPKVPFAVTRHKCTQDGKSPVGAYKRVEALQF